MKLELYGYIKQAPREIMPIVCMTLIEKNASFQRQIEWQSLLLGYISQWRSMSKTSDYFSILYPYKLHIQDQEITSLYYDSNQTWKVVRRQNIFAKLDMETVTDRK